MIHLKQYVGQSISTLQRRLKKKPPQEEAELISYAIGMAYFRQREFKKAYGCFRKCVVISAEFAEPIYRMGECMFKLKRYESALESFQDVERRFPRYVDTAYNIGIIYHRLKRFKEGARYLESYRFSHPHDSSIDYYLGQCYAGMGRSGIDKAAEYFEKASRAGKFRERARLDLGILRLRSAIDSRSESRFREALEFENRLKRTRRVPKIIRAQLHSFLGNLFEEDPKTVPKAIRHYMNAISHDKTDPANHEKVAALLLAEGKLDQSLKHAIKSVELKPDNESAYDVIQLILTRVFQSGEQKKLSKMINTINRSRGLDVGRLIIKTLAQLDDENRERNYANMHKLKNIMNVLCSRTINVRNRVGDTGLGAKGGDGNGAVLDSLDELIQMEKKTIQDVVNFLKMMTHAAPNRELENINNLINRICLILRHQDELEGRQIRIDLRLDENLPLIKVNRDEMSEALTNIVMNACQSSDSKEIVVEIETIRAEYDIKIMIRDDGAGIKPEHLDQIFTSGFTTKPGGSGYGLNIAKKIIVEHFGNIDIKNRYKRGTEVIITLPVTVDVDFSEPVSTNIKTFKEAKAS